MNKILKTKKLSRPQFNQMDTTEKQALMESLAARYYDLSRSTYL